jgi:hypothetical protein
MVFNLGMLKYLADHIYSSSANAVAAVSSTVALEQPFLLDLLVNLANDPIPGVRIGVARAFRFFCMTGESELRCERIRNLCWTIVGGPYDFERPPRLQAALVRLATTDNTAAVRELLVDVRLDPLPDDFGPDDIGEDASFSSSDEEDAGDAAGRTDPSGSGSRSRAIPFSQTIEAQENMSSVASPPVDTWNLADLASPPSKIHTNKDTSYTSLESLLPQPARGRSSPAISHQCGASDEPFAAGRCNSSFSRRLFTPSNSPLPHDTQSAPEQQSWHLSMRDVDQFVAIDLAV